MARLRIICFFSWEEKHFFSFFSYEEKHFAELWIVVSYFTLEAIVGWCSAKVGVLQNTILNIVLLNLWSKPLRSSRPEVFLGKGVPKICSKSTGEHPCWIAISIKLQSKIIEITIRHGCSPVNLLHIFRTPFLKNTSGRLPLIFEK